MKVYSLSNALLALGIILPATISAPLGEALPCIDWEGKLHDEPGNSAWGQQRYWSMYKDMGCKPKYKLDNNGTCKSHMSMSNRCAALCTTAVMWIYGPPLDHLQTTPWQRFTCEPGALCAKDLCEKSDFLVKTISYGIDKSWQLAETGSNAETYEKHGDKNNGTNVANTKGEVDSDSMTTGMVYGWEADISVSKKGKPPLIGDLIEAIIVTDTVGAHGDYHEDKTNGYSTSNSFTIGYSESQTVGWSES